MPRFKKEIIAPKRYWVALRDRTGTVQYDGAGKVITVPFDVSREHVRALYETQRRMLDSGLAIPCPFGHDFQAVPTMDPAAAKVASNSGFVVDCELGADGTLYNTLSIDYVPGARTDAEIADRLRKCIRYVSPNIVPELVDGAGRRWEQAITHVALTPTPIHIAQAPFDGVALSVGYPRFPLTGPLALSTVVSFGESTMNPLQQLQQLVQRLASADLETQQMALAALQEIVGEQAEPKQEPDTSGTAGGGGTLTAMSQEGRRPLTAKQRRDATLLEGQEKCGAEMARWALSTY